MENKDDQIIRSAMRSHLSGLQLSRQGHLALKDKIQGGEPVKKRIPVALVLAMALILITLTALAVNSLIERHAREVMEIGENYGLLRWNLEDKIAFVDAMERAELEMDQDQLKKLRAEGTPAEEKERLADSLIDARYGKMLKKLREDIGVDEFDLPKAPTADLVYKEAYLREHPQATDEEMAAAFDAFMFAYYKEKGLVLTQEEQDKIQAEKAARPATEDEIKEKMLNNLTETGMGLDAWEASKANITAVFDK